MNECSFLIPLSEYATYIIPSFNAYLLCAYAGNKTDMIPRLMEKVGIEHKMPGALSVRKETCTVNWEPT